MVLEPLIEKCVEEIERDILAFFLAKDKFERDIVHRIECFLIQFLKHLFLCQHVRASSLAFILSHRYFTVNIVFQGAGRFSCLRAIAQIYLPFLQIISTPRLYPQT